MRFRHATFFQQQRQHVACRRPQGLHKLTRNKLLYWDTGHGTITTSTYVCMYACTGPIFQMLTRLCIESTSKQLYFFLHLVLFGENQISGNL